MDTLDLYEAKTNSSQLVDRAAAGEEIIIGKAGRPLARLVPLASERKRPRALGWLADEVWIGDDFDAPLPDEMMKAFNGELPSDSCLIRIS